MCLGGIYDNNLLCGVGFILWIINILLASRLYNLIFYDANTTCGFYAGKAALENGFDPKAQNGILWEVIPTRGINFLWIQSALKIKYLFEKQR